MIKKWLKLDIFRADKTITDEKYLYWLGEKLAHLNARPLADGLFRIVRFRRRNCRPDLGKEPQANPQKPKGPFKLAGPKPDAAIIDFVPRNIKSRLIDNVTGVYGYSHITVDLGEIDEPTGKRVMIESTPFDVVHYAYQDEYGTRPFIRIPLEKVGVNLQEFSICIKSKLGEKYDDYEALTWGEIDDPAKQVCSDLAAGCLPEEMRQDIARKREIGLLKERSVSVHHRRDGSLGVFVSPNGFGEYFQAPHGEKVKMPGETVEPKIIVPVTEKVPVPISPRSTRRRIITAGVLLGIATTAIIVTIVLSKKPKPTLQYIRLE